MEDLIKECYCSRKGEMYNSSVGYKLCFTCGQHNVELTEETYVNLPKLYKENVEVDESKEYFQPFMYNSEDVSIVLDLNEQNEKVWRIIPILDGEPELIHAVKVPYLEFYTVYQFLMNLQAKSSNQ